MKLLKYFIVAVFIMACEAGEQSQQPRERKQTVVNGPSNAGENNNNQDGNKNTDQTTEGSEQVPSSSFDTSTSTKGSIDPEFRVAGGPTSFQSRPVNYGEGSGGSHKGFYIRGTESSSSRPGVIAIHGLAGLTEEFKRNLMRFVARGYRVLAIDLYEGQLPGQGSNSVDSLNQGIQARGKADVLSNIISGAEYLRDELNVTDLGVVGWDEGGYWAIETMITFPGTFAALVNYNGSPFELSRLGSSIPIPTLHIFPHEDRQTEEYLELERSLNEASLRKVEFRIYRDVASDFLEPSNPNKDEVNIGIAYDHTFSYLDTTLKRN